MDFYGFHIKKTPVLAHLFIEKGHTDPFCESSHYYSARQYKNILLSYLCLKEEAWLK